MPGEQNKTEQNIAKFFDNESSSMRDRHEEDGIPKTAKKHVKDIVTLGSKSAIDVGSGPGSIMIELLNSGVDEVIGVDLSEEMNRIAMDRIEQKGYANRATIIQDSFLTTPSTDTDAVSIHRVLCCHPNREAMLQKATEKQPKVITLTIPRDWKVLKGILAIVGIFLKLIGSFRPYIHSQKTIDNQLEQKGYQIESRYKELFWITTTYIRDNTQSNENGTD